MRWSLNPSYLKMIVVLLAAMAGAAGLVILYLFDPATHGFYPVCPFHELTGLSCPGCGTLRALHQLTRGNFTAAWGFNPLMLSLLPAGLWLGIREVVRLTTGRKWPGIVTRPIFGWAVVGALVVFGVLRNVPLAR